jgi:hypothetical protein
VSSQLFVLPLSLAIVSQWSKDAIVGSSDEKVHASSEVNIPNYASAVVTTNEVVDSLASLQALGISAS